MQHDSDSGDALAAGRRSAQPERTNQYFFWASSTDTNENQSLLSGAPTRAPTPSNSDSESSRVSLSAEADAAGVSRGNSFGASAAYGTFFGRTQIAPEHDVENQSSDGEEQAAEPTHLIPSPQFLLFSAACLGTITMACFVHPPATSFGAIASTVAGNAPTAFCFFFISEIAAQVIEFGRIVDLPRCDPFRAILAGFLGMLINGLGYTLWLRMLTAMIPIDETGVGSETDFGLLLAKTLIDSLFWGTLSNTVGLVGRRIILERDSLADARDVWYRTILPVTNQEFKFWPTWTLVNFLLIRSAFQVNFTSFGSLIWNCYLSWVAHHVRARPHHEVDDIAVAHRSPPLRAKIAAMSPVIRARAGAGASPEKIVDASRVEGEGFRPARMAQLRLDEVSVGETEGGGGASGSGTGRVRTLVASL